MVAEEAVPDGLEAGDQVELSIRDAEVAEAAAVETICTVPEEDKR
jgi:hypothetical protein